MHEHGPGFSGLNTFPVEVKDNKIYVRVNRSLLAKFRDEEIINKTSHKEDHFVIVGGGLSGVSAIEALVKSGFGGKITLISSEDTLPYDRTILSKNINIKDDHIHVKN